MENKNVYIFRKIQGKFRIRQLGMVSEHIKEEIHKGIDKTLWDGVLNPVSNPYGGIRNSLQREFD